MTFPLGSLRSDTGAASASGSAAHGGTYTRSNARGAPPPAAQPADAPHHPSWKVQLQLLAGGVVWLLALLALATHTGGDPAFSTSGSTPVTRNAAGALGAWFSDLAFFLLGYSAWWLMA